ncbi:MAG TPA: hypothetical protein PK728_10430 [Bacillota bacterium]|nr:hypothetical protein [Bacillota bacterium]
MSNKERKKYVLMKEGKIKFIKKDKIMKTLDILDDGIVRQKKG